MPRRRRLVACLAGWIIVRFPDRHGALVEPRGHLGQLPGHDREALDHRVNREEILVATQEIALHDTVTARRELIRLAPTIGLRADVVHSTNCAIRKLEAVRALHILARRLLIDADPRATPGALVDGRRWRWRRWIMDLRRDVTHAMHPEMS